MDIHNLIKQANPICDFYGAWPDPAQGRDEIASHLKRFWEPRLRRQTIAHMRGAAGTGRSAIVIAAIERLEPVGVDA